MAQRKGSRGTAESASDWLGGLKWLAATGFVLVLFYWIPLLGPDSSIQGNAADLYQPLQRYFAETVKSGSLPHWTNYLAAGFPLLSDPQAGGFYPLNWPFFLAGAGPGAIQAELALHALIAVCGAFLLFRLLTGNARAGLAAALSYGLGGYFAAHSSHVSMFQSAALLPWVLYCYERSGDGRRLAWLSGATVAAGFSILAGSLGSGVMVLAALVLWAVWRRLDGVGVALIVAGALALASVVLAPALLLWLEARPENYFVPMSASALATILLPGGLGGFKPGTDLTRNYLYSGILLLPLALFALRNRSHRLPAALFIGLPAVAAFAHSADHWFVCAFGLSMLAAFGIVEAERHWRKEYLGVVILVVFAGDLCAFNSWNNRLTYARSSYYELYGRGQGALAKLALGMPSGFRVEMAAGSKLFGSLNAGLIEHVEVTGGFNPLNLSRWREYRRACGRNARLVDGLSAYVKVEVGKEEVSGNPTVLPRAYFAREVIGVSSSEGSLARLATLNPAQQALVQLPYPGVQQDPAARALGIRFTANGIEVLYKAGSSSLMKLTNVYYPGWSASVEGKPVEVLRVDHALMGAVVPAGEHTVTFAFITPRFVAGALISAVTALGLLLLALRRERR